MWVIPRVIVNKILGHAQRTAPEECVGILSGDNRTIQGWHPLTNQRRDPRRFLADSGQQIRLFKQLREQDRQVVAIYHSHPKGPPEPSALDLEQAHYPEALYLIVSLDTDGRLDLAGFLIRDSKADPQELTIRD